jgi:hypothetical protein
VTSNRSSRSAKRQKFANTTVSLPCTSC